MKAILIIDVDENADFENAIADITFRENEWGLAPLGIRRWHNGIKAKPLPQKKDAFEEHMKVESNERYISETLINQIRGYNFCIDEILGEE